MTGNGARTSLQEVRERLADIDTAIASLENVQELDETQQPRLRAALAVIKEQLATVRDTLPPPHA